MSRVTDNHRVIVAMSGGVDSSVAALLLLQAGYEVIGATFDTGFGEPCAQAAAVCRQLGIAHHVLDLRREFQQTVIDEFVAAYLRGETPNPCVNCNPAFKFPAFLPLMQQLDAYYLATGHYVRLREHAGRFLLYRANTAKDQSYFLYRLPQSLLSRCLFPLGELDKAQVRALAAEAKLPSAAQKDSFDICFIREGGYRELLRGHDSAYTRPGDIVTAEGRVCGRHQGLANFTPGQRRGLNVSLGYPAYVVGIDAAENRIIVGERERLLRGSARLRDCCFIALERFDNPLEAEVKIRYQAPPVKALIRADEDDAAVLRIDFETPVWNITPGQSGVIFQGDLLLGGGIFLPD